MTITHARLGDTVTFSKTVGEADVYLFAGITGDFSPNHVNEQFMQGTAYGRRIVHGALLVGFMSTASARMQAGSIERGIDTTPVSLGYDGLRFLKPVFFGDTVTVHYKISAIDEERARTVADMEVTNQHGELVSVGKHITKWVSNEARL
ncbi:MaoC/PaaZ C-terminal domain-containing protein [Herbaspirillum sp. WKF16]|uniref:MaoC/PaaZ C-terminal domain-containing protein n=1 Tax=Herbaspirillum sp. WKF16 TaxID=3028312 RepID=UPI0023A99A7B|nr:MaoC/PaaZ C-terminal domain-containing protein [Herbaspirillum sp. WKF16]WDZ95957.1 MaoC/PaaZ C-terminal domain-containing protein [Herbaspirillum sp. WKF16]